MLLFQSQFGIVLYVIHLTCILGEGKLYSPVTCRIASAWLHSELFYLINHVVMSVFQGKETFEPDYEVQSTSCSYSASFMFVSLA